MPHHIGQRRAAQIDVGTGVLFRLPMQRLMIAILRHRDVGEQAGTGPATPDRQLWHGCLHDGLAAAAGELRPNMAHDAEPAGDVVEDLGLVAAERMQLAAAGRAAAIGIAGRRMGDDRARQCLRQRRTHRLVVRLGLSGRQLCCRVCLRGLFLAVGQQQLELLDLGAELLRGLPEPGA